MSNATTVLVVEDDTTLREALCDTLEFGGHKALSAIHGQQALQVLAKQSVDLIISDVQMDVMDGNALLRELKTTHPELPVVMMSAHGSIEKAVQAMREGATDYLVKPFETEVLLETVSRVARGPDDNSSGFVAQDPVMIKLYSLADRVAASDATVMISGESGTGKEVLARYLHSQSARADKPFIAINCAAIPESMLESMLFGYEKGAYTGAHQARAGKFEQANGGTLLLDEISEMDLALQAKLLRVLQEREVERLGGNKTIALDVRVLATTNRRLRDEVSEGRFREDLFYRLQVFPLTLPALRERPKDIAPLALHLLAKSSDRNLSLSQDAIAALQNYHWPGNVRELENTLQRAAILASGDSIEAADIIIEGAEPIELHSTPPHSGDLKSREQQLLVQALQNHGGSRKATAEDLGISPRTLRYKLARLKEQGIAIPEAS